MTFENALSRMTALCSLSEHCESEVREKLQRVDLSAKEVQRIVDYLYDEHYMDTARYCRAFSRDKLRFAHWGRIKIQQALHLKGLPDADIREALDSLPEEEYSDILQKLIVQKASTLHDEDEYLRRGKIIRFAAGRGFTMDEILKAL